MNPRQTRLSKFLNTRPLLWLRNWVEAHAYVPPTMNTPGHFTTALDPYPLRFNYPTAKPPSALRPEPPTT